MTDKKCVRVSTDGAHNMIGICYGAAACVKAVTRSKIYSVLYPQGIISNEENALTAKGPFGGI
jgi:protein-disulfide isomerase-like protein with CxxC motif